VLVTGRATLDPANGNLISRAPIIAHVKYDQYGVPKFVHPADVNSDGVVDALDTQHWLNAWREYRTHNTTSTPPSEIWKGTVDSNESGVVDESTDGADPTQPSATNTDWLAFLAQYAAATAQGNVPLDQQLGNLPLYAGYWWDDAIGLYHVRHRVYRPEWGRWLQRDPLGYAPGWNLYQYVNGTPWSAVDPMGLESFPFEWNHELPQSIFGPDGYLAGEGIRIPGIDQEFIDQSDYGSIMRWTDHRGTGNMATHIEYNNAWKSWLKEQIETGRSITKDSVLDQLNKYREGSSFKDWLGKGKRATNSYKEWGGKSNADKINWLIKEGKNLLSKEEIKSFREILRAAQRSGTAIKFVHVLSEGVKGVGKVAKVLTPIVIVANIASGEEVMRATVDGLLPVDIDTIDELRHDGLTIIDESMNQRRYRVHRGTDSLLHELTGIPQNERTPLSSTPSCNPR
jgi:RHS repeat-associated protein